MLSALAVPVLLVSLSACADSSDAPSEAASPVADEERHWSYEAGSGPDDWAAMSLDNAACAAGREQSPVALTSTSAAAADLPSLEVDYGAAMLDVQVTDHGYLATPNGDQRVRLGDDDYSLLQFHPHTPSEHTLDGERYPLELHFVHRDAEGGLAVVGVMVEEGDENDALASVVAAAGAPGAASEAGEGAQVEALADVLPDDRDYFTYDGSLTTPPCTEGVRWLVLGEPIEMSADQIAAFADARGSRYRPLQPLNDRAVRMSMAN
ncbi:carbonic anhydrase [Rubrivirga sp. IMCC45206]|uniref:carbonic anhydrase n=1 Tax=Rubrivirga sp. IMCC45206 TaxID=3391614 RepID=UPI00398FC223